MTAQRKRALFRKRPQAAGAARAGIVTLHWSVIETAAIAMTIDETPKINSRSVV
jgi:hypothetical protein